MTTESEWVERDVDSSTETYAERHAAMAGVEAAADQYFEDGSVDVGVGSTQFNSPVKREYVAVESDGVEAEVYMDRVRVRRTGDGPMSETDEDVLAFAYAVAEDGAPETGVAVGTYPDVTDRPPVDGVPAVEVDPEYDAGFDAFLDDVAGSYVDTEVDEDVDGHLGEFPA